MVEPCPPEVAEGVGAEDVEEAEGDPLVRELSVLSVLSVLSWFSPAAALSVPSLVARSPRVKLMVSICFHGQVEDPPDTETDSQTSCKQKQDSTEDPPKLLPALSLSVVCPSR